jgi:hypothetical protein
LKLCNGTQTITVILALILKIGSRLCAIALIWIIHFKWTIHNVTVHKNIILEPTIASQIGDLASLGVIELSILSQRGHSTISQFNLWGDRTIYVTKIIVSATAKWQVGNGWTISNGLSWSVTLKLAFESNWTTFMTFEND